MREEERVNLVEGQKISCIKTEKLKVERNSGTHSVSSPFYYPPLGVGT